MVAVVDTNVLVYRYDARVPRKQAVASELLRDGLSDGSLRLAHQAIIEFVAATTRPLPGSKRGLLTLEEAVAESEELLSLFPVLYPTEALVRTALRGAVAYQLSWFDAHMWAYAETAGASVLYSEDLQTERMYGSVRVLDPFA